MLIHHSSLLGSMSYCFSNTHYNLTRPFPGKAFHDERRMKIEGKRHKKAGMTSVYLLVIYSASYLLGSMYAQSPTALATASPTPLPTWSSVEVQLNASVEAITPPQELVTSLFSTDVKEEIPQQKFLATAVRFEWNRLLNSSFVDDPIAAPFIMCTEGGRAGVVSMLSHVKQQTRTPLPIYSSSNLTCYVVQSYAAEVINQTISQPNVKYSAPVLSQLKLGKGLFGQAYAGGLLNDSRVCQSGLRVVLAPGIGESKKMLNALVRVIKAGLLSGGYQQHLTQEFIWTSFSSHKYNGSRSTSAHHGGNTTGRRLRKGTTSTRMTQAEAEADAEGGGGGGANNTFSTTTATDTTPARGQQWSQKLYPVLNGSIICDWSALYISAQSPYLRIDGYCDVLDPSLDLAGASACLTALLAYLSTNNNILYIEPYPLLQTWNVVAAAVSQSATSDSFPLWDKGLNGTGQVIQVADTGLDMQSCFFNDSTGNVATTTYSTAAFDSTRRKVVQYVVWADSTDVVNGHGTHVSGTVAGYCEKKNDGYNANYEGVAPAAKIAFYDGGNSAGALAFPSNLKAKLFPPGYTAGARIFSNSWGSTSNSYTYLDTEVDSFMISYPDTLILVAAGNFGSSGTNTVYSPGVSKNGLAIGASQSLRDSTFNVSAVAFFSAQGPTADGRIKPDFVAPGYRLYSALAGSTCSVVDKLGTSMATPVASASAALVRQYFMEGYYPTGKKVAANAFIPTGALMKAMLINSAVPMKKYVTSTGAAVMLGLPPDNYQGFGRLQLDQVLNLAGSVSLWVADWVSIAEGQSHVYIFSIPRIDSDINPFKATLTWIDPYTSATSGTLVLHNLDLSMTSTLSNTVYYPNGLTSADSKNTVEKIVEYNPTKGDIYTVTVAATSVSTNATQWYALVASGTFYSGAWYCQSPLSTRLSLDYTTENCQLSCGLLSKNPICCSTKAGAVCTVSEMLGDLSVCDAFAKPWDCISPSPAPTKLPTKLPTQQPTATPTTLAPTKAPTQIPSRLPSKMPTAVPSQRPTKTPTLNPSIKPTNNPTQRPTSPSKAPSMSPTSPTVRPSMTPTSPTSAPSLQPQPATDPPSQVPSSTPTLLPTTSLTQPPSLQPTVLPTNRPSNSPSPMPSKAPSSRPSLLPTNVPSILPTNKPSQVPSLNPTSLPTSTPSLPPTSRPTNGPSMAPSCSPTLLPTSLTSFPTLQPTSSPTNKPSQAPSSSPTILPTSTTVFPTLQPSSSPTLDPTSLHPSNLPTNSPSKIPSTTPTFLPTNPPTFQASSLQPSTMQPTVQPSLQTSKPPSGQPTTSPTQPLTQIPSRQPTTSPTQPLTQSPSLQPSNVPSTQPTTSLTQPLTQIPSRQPTTSPTQPLTQSPSLQPSNVPSTQPTTSPTQPLTQIPSRQPTTSPTQPLTQSPSLQPSNVPSTQPTTSLTQPLTQIPSRQPTTSPTQPLTQSPSLQPSNVPSTQPTTSPTQPLTQIPSRQPTTSPTQPLTQSPSLQPSNVPSTQPTTSPTQPLTQIPSRQPTTSPTQPLTQSPSLQPSNVPSTQPTTSLTQPLTQIPSRQPTTSPTQPPTQSPSLQPSNVPSTQPTTSLTQPLTQIPSRQPTTSPTQPLTQSPSLQPSNVPSTQPTTSLTQPLTQIPSRQPTTSPTQPLTQSPSLQPSNVPSTQPTTSPTQPLTQIPSRQPTTSPTQPLTQSPSLQPSNVPNTQPTTSPTQSLTQIPSRQPTTLPTQPLTQNPSHQPSDAPSLPPTQPPSKTPSRSPTKLPTKRPTKLPTKVPTNLPTNLPTPNPPTDAPTPITINASTLEVPTAPTSVPTSQGLGSGPETPLNTSTFSVESGSVTNAGWSYMVMILTSVVSVFLIIV